MNEWKGQRNVQGEPSGSNKAQGASSRRTSGQERRLDEPSLAGKSQWRCAYEEAVRKHQRSQDRADQDAGGDNKLYEDGEDS